VKDIPWTSPFFKRNSPSGAQYNDFGRARLIIGAIPPKRAVISPLNIWCFGLSAAVNLALIIFGVEPSKGSGDLAGPVQIPFFPAADFHVIFGAGMVPLKRPHESHMCACAAHQIAGQCQIGEFTVKPCRHIGDGLPPHQRIATIDRNLPVFGVIGRNRFGVTGTSGGRVSSGCFINIAHIKSPLDE
jgi:hypothetical protein